MSHQYQSGGDNPSRIPLCGTVPLGKYGRMFPGLPALELAPEGIQSLAEAMFPPEPSPDNPDLPAGYTFLGQFIDHDVTFDPTSIQEVRVDPNATTNYRTPMLSLDHLYGRGPQVDPQLYQATRYAKFQLGQNNPPVVDKTIGPHRAFDLQRAPFSRFAIIGDPRNDENLIVSQLHVAMQYFHNEVVNAIVEGVPVPATAKKPIDVSDQNSLFAAARSTVIEHYHCIVLNDYLPRILDSEVLRTVRKNGSLLYRDRAALDRDRAALYCDQAAPFIPVEFSVAAFRFGHSTIRDQYNYNRLFSDNGIGGKATLKSLFELTAANRAGAVQVPVPGDWIIDWRRFFDFGKPGLLNPSGCIGPRLAVALKNITGLPDPSNLAKRNLMRGNMLGLPSGQMAARYFGYEPLSPDSIKTSGLDGEAAFASNFHKNTPLWYYILKEAQLDCGGKTLGRLGSRICAEVLVGLLEQSKSPLISDPDWRPSLPSGDPSVFTMRDLLSFSGFVNPIG